MLYFRSIITTLFLLGTLLTSAQTASIKGKVIDKKTGEELIGVNVFIEGTTNGAAADINGNYALKVTPGVYTVVASFLSYATEKRENIEVKAGEDKIINFSLGESSINMKEFVIEAKQSRNTENALIRIQQKSITIQDAISGQEIKRSGASDAAESAKKVTGITVVDGKHIFVRGLGDRYTYTQLNGVTLQSPDPYRNSAQLDLIPASLLDNIITSKTFTPDQPGTFTGGNVNLTTKTYPEKLVLNFSSSISWNPQSSFNNEFLTHQGGKTDWLGFDDGGRAMPEILKDKEVRDRLNTAFYIKARNYRDTALLLDKASKSLNPQMAPVEGTYFTNTSYSFSIGNQKKVFGKTLGFILGLNYRSGFTYYDDGISAAYEAGGGTDAESLFERFNLVDRKGTENPQLNGLMSVNYRLHKNHELSANIIYNKDTEKTTRYLYGSALGFTAREAPLESRVLSFKERTLGTYQLRGKHTFTKLKNAEVEWITGYTQTEMNEPDLRFFANEIVDDTLYQINASTYNLPTHFFRNLNDTLLEGKMDITIPLSKNTSDNKLKFGGLVSRKDRTFTENNFYFRQGPQYMGLGPESYQGDPTAFFGPENTGWIDTTEGGKNIIGNYVVNGSDPKNNYSGFEEIKSAYAMTVMKLNKKTKLIAGVRAEHTRMEVSSADSSGSFCWDTNGNMVGDPEEDINGDGNWDINDCEGYGKINQLDFLPALSMVYALNEKTNLRGSVSRTIARPTMRELAPFSSFDFVGGFVYVGNPQLKRSSILNLDLRWEYFAKPGELMAVSAFYKNFKDPVVKIYNPKTSNPEILYSNSEKADIYGLEFEVRKNLSALNAKLKNFKFNGNFTYIVSRVALDSAEYENSSALNPEIKSTRPFAGQSPYIANAGLSYSNDSLGLELSAYYNVFGKRLAELGQNGLPDSYEQARHSLSFNLIKTLGKHFSIRVAGSNLLNNPFIKKQSYKEKEYILSSYKTGPTFTLGLSYFIK